MPRANRHFVSGHIWHLTHRCHKKEFLLKFARDRKRWRQWLFEARKRFGLCVLNYIVTCNHIHLLVLDQGREEIANSMQLIAGRVGQEYNRRKIRQGAFWEDRYHATAVERAIHLARCLTYIDMNMVRTGAISHPAQWPLSGYSELMDPPRRFTAINTSALMDLLDFTDLTQLQAARAQWVADALQAGNLRREPHWTQSLAVGSPTFVEAFQQATDARNRNRKIVDHGTCCSLGEAPESYEFDLA